MLLLCQLCICLMFWFHVSRLSYMPSASIVFLFFLLIYRLGCVLLLLDFIVCHLPEFILIFQLTVKFYIISSVVLFRYFVLKLVHGVCDSDGVLCICWLLNLWCFSICLRWICCIMSSTLQHVVVFSQKLTWNVLSVMVLFVSYVSACLIPRKAILYIRPWCHILSFVFDKSIMNKLHTCLLLMFLMMVSVSLGVSNAFVISRNLYCSIGIVFVVR